MSRTAGVWFDAGNLAARRALLEREFALSEFPRLADRLTAQDGRVAARLELETVEGTPVGELVVRAQLPLCCQRCLRPMVQALESSSRVAFVADADARTPVGTEAFVTDPQQVDLRALVEDELLLGLPVAPRHGPDEDCALGTAATPKLGRPLAGLQELLKN